MSIEIVSFVLGPAFTNVYLLADSTSGEAAVIDPAWDGATILNAAVQRNWRISHLWITHAHFDHIAAVGGIVRALTPSPSVALHPADCELWQVGGGAQFFGFQIDPVPAPTLELVHGQRLRLGSETFEVRHTPGHSPGHVAFYCAQAGICFCGDLIFAGSVGRTDLPGGDWTLLQASIREQIYTLVDETRLFSGHGPETDVRFEKANNPFVSPI